MTGSDVSAASSASSTRKLTLDDIVKRVHGILRGSDAIPAHRHASVVRSLCQLRDSFHSGETPTKEQLVLLLCSGVALQKRVLAFGDDEDDMSQSDANLRDNLVTTMTLVFVLIAMVSPVSDAVEPAKALIDGANSTSLWERLTSQTTESDGEIAQAVLTVAADELPRATPDAMTRHSVAFFRHSMAAMQAMKFREFGPDQFLTLSAARFCGAVSNDDSAPGVESIVAAAESEAGQAVLRDIFLSFTLPTEVVGRRRALLLARATASAATVDFADRVQEAHDAAMAGAEYLWNNATDDFRKMCALLAGLACMLTTQGEDAIRKGLAFDGRVDLPFLNGPATPSKKPQICLVQSTKTWVLYTLDRSSHPVVEASAEGLEGLKLAALGLFQSL